MGAPVEARVARLAPWAADAAGATDDTLAPPPPAALAAARAGLMRLESFPEIRGGSGFSRFTLLSDIELKVNPGDETQLHPSPIHTPILFWCRPLFFLSWSMRAM